MLQKSVENTSIGNLVAPERQKSEQSLEQSIAAQFGVTPIPEEFAEFVRENLTKTSPEGLPALLFDVHNFLNEHGFASEERYYKEAVAPGEIPTQPPLMTIVATNTKGEFGFPNYNQIIDAVDLRDNSQDLESKEKLTYTSLDREEAPENRYRVPLEVERFPSDAPVHITTEYGQLSSGEGAYFLKPIFSPKAFEFACEHASRAAKREINQYSYILDEKVIPAVNAYMQEVVPFYGERTLPTYTDQGTHTEGKLFKLKIEASEVNGDLTIVELSVSVNLDPSGEVVTKVTPR